MWEPASKRRKTDPLAGVQAEAGENRGKEEREGVAVITNDLLRAAEGSESIDQTKSGSSILESVLENIAKSLTEDVSSVIADSKNQASLLKISFEEEKSRNLSLTLEVDSLKTNLEKVAKEKESEIQLKDVAITDLKNELKLK